MSFMAYPNVAYANPWDVIRQDPKMMMMTNPCCETPTEKKIKEIHEWMKDVHEFVIGDVKGLLVELNKVLTAAGNPTNFDPAKTAFKTKVDGMKLYDKLITTVMNATNIIKTGTLAVTGVAYAPSGVSYSPYDSTGYEASGQQSYQPSSSSSYKPHSQEMTTYRPYVPK